MVFEIPASDQNVFQIPEEDKQQTTSITGALGRGALDAVPFGVKGAAGLESTVTGGNYDKYLKELDDLIEADRQQHPVAHGIGEVAGTVAPFAIPGVGEALGAETLAGRAGIGAGLGALEGASETRAPLTSEEGIKDIAKSAGLGALINPAVGGALDIAAKGLSKAAPSLEEMANTKAVQAGNLRPGTLGLPEDELNALGKQMREWDLVQGDTGERLKKAQVLTKVVGGKIGDIGANAAPLEDATPFIDKLQQEAEKSARFFGPEGNADLNTYRQGIANIQNNGKDFESLQALKQAYGEKAFDANGQVKDPAAAKVYSQIKDAMKSIIASSPQEYQDAMNHYGMLKDISNGLQKQLQAEQAHGTQVKGFGLMGKLGGMMTGGNIPLTVGSAGLLAAAGHPFGALGLASTLTQNAQLMSKAAESAAEMAANGAQAMGKSATAPLATHLGLEASHAGPKIPEAYHHVFVQAVKGLSDPSEIQKKTSITDFVLQSRDPNYVKAKAEMTNEP